MASMSFMDSPSKSTTCDGGSAVPMDLAHGSDKVVGVGEEERVCRLS